LSVDGEKLLVGCQDGEVQVYDVSTGILDFECAESLGECVVFVHWTEEFIIAATGSESQAISWHDVKDPVKVLIANRKDGSIVRTWNTGEPGVGGNCFSTSLNMFFTGHIGGKIIGWGLDGNEVVRQDNNLGGVVYALASHSDLILSGSNDHVIREWKVSKESKKIDLVNQITDTTSSGWAFGGNWSVSYDHAGDRILSTEPHSQSLRIYHKNGSLLEELRGHQDCITKISLVDDGHRAVTCDRDQMSILWNLPETSNNESSNEKIDDAVRWCDFSPDGSQYVTAAEGVLRIFDTETKALLHTRLGVCKHYCCAGRWMPDGKHFVVVNTQRSVAWFDCELKQVSELACFSTDDSSCTGVAISPDGTRAVVVDCRNSQSSLSAGTIINCSDVSNPVQCGSVSDYGGRMFACDINHSGKLLAIAGHQGTVVYDLQTLERKYSFDSGCFLVKFKSDDKLIYESDNGLYLYDPEREEDIVTYNGHTAPVQNACFLDNENMILTASDDGTMRLYDTTSGENVYGFFSHQAQSYKSLSVHPNEKMIIAADESRILFILSTEE